MRRLVVLGAALVIAQTNKPAGVTNGACCATSANPAMLASMALSNAPATPSEKLPLPKLLDLGAGKCIPCKMMAPDAGGIEKGICRQAGRGVH